MAMVQAIALYLLITVWGIIMIRFDEDNDRYVISSDGTDVGWMEFNQEEGYIHGIYILPEYRNYGFATECIRWAFENAGSYPVIIEITNPVLVPVVERMGWIETERTMLESRRFESV
jgi:GNAT superfamily N-acetyltransferase